MSNGLSQVIVKCPSVVLSVRMFNCKLFKCLSFVKCEMLSVCQCLVSFFYKFMKITFVQYLEFKIFTGLHGVVV